jgi:hypothetical protein
MEKIIKAAVERGASDLHIKAGDVFRARINGKLVPLTKQRLTPDQTRAIALKLMPGDEARNRLDSLKDFDCSWGMPGVGRFRVNVLRQALLLHDRDAGDSLYRAHHRGSWDYRRRSRLSPRRSRDWCWWPESREAGRPPPWRRW